MERRFFISGDALTPDGEARIGGDEGRHLARVLRLRPGDAVELLDGQGRSFRARLRKVGSDAAVARIEAELAFRRGESPFPVDLVQAVPKGNLLDAIVRRATELGVATIQPVTARRSPPQGAFPGRLERWRRIAREAVKQCGRSVVPEVRAPLGAEACLRRPPAGEGWLLHPGGAPLASRLGPAGRPHPEGLVLGVGPEGGWTDAEAAAARAAGYRVISLGERILRVETASLLLTALAQLRFGDFGRPL